VSQVLVPRIRPLDVFKALFAFSCQAVLSLVTFPVLSDATKYAMAALKHSVHSCYFCYHRQTAGLDQEVAFFNQRFGPSRTLMELLMLRRRYQRSFGFVIRCLPSIMCLHLRTARDARFPVHRSHLILPLISPFSKPPGYLTFVIANPAYYARSVMIPHAGTSISSPAFFNGCSPRSLSQIFLGSGFAQVSLTLCEVPELPKSRMILALPSSLGLKAVMVTESGTLTGGSGTGKEVALAAMRGCEAEAPS